MKGAVIVLLMALLLSSHAQASLLQYNFESDVLAFEGPNLSQQGYFSGQMVVDSKASKLTRFKVDFTDLQDPQDNFSFYWTGASDIYVQIYDWGDAYFCGISLPPMSVDRRSFDFYIEIALQRDTNPLEQIHSPLESYGYFVKENGEELYTQNPKFSEPAAVKVPEASSLSLLLLGALALAFRRRKK